MNRAIYFLILFSFLVSCKKDETKKLEFKDCVVEYPSYGSGEKELYVGHSISNKWELESAKRKLALCLCEKYLENPDLEIKLKILEIYNSKEEYFEHNSPKNIDFKIILKNRNEIFNPSILID